MVGLDEEIVYEEDLVGECCYLLDNIILQDYVKDSLFWKHDLVHGYSVKGVFNLLPTNVPQA